MKRNHKLLALANRNYTPLKKYLTKPVTKPSINYSISNTNETYHENWSVDDGGVEVDLNAIDEIGQNFDLNKNCLNGVDINDFDIILKESFAHNNGA